MRRLLNAHQRVGVRELRGRLSEYLRRARDGEQFDIMVRGRCVAVLSRHDDEVSASALPKRQFGRLKGMFAMPDEAAWRASDEAVAALFEGRDHA